MYVTYLCLQALLACLVSSVHTPRPWQRHLLSSFPLPPPCCGSRVATYLCLCKAHSGTAFKADFLQAQWFTRQTSQPPPQQTQGSSGAWMRISVQQAGRECIRRELGGMPGQWCWWTLAGMCAEQGRCWRTPWHLGVPHEWEARPGSSFSALIPLSKMERNS